MRDSSIVTPYRAVNVAACRGVRKASSCPPVGGINSINLNSFSVKIIIKQCGKPLLLTGYNSQNLKIAT